MRLRPGWIPSVLIGVLLIAGGGIGLLLAASHTARLPGTPVAVPLPDVTLSSMEGKAVNLADLRGRPLLINFWATWCPPCQEEMPALARIDRKWRERGAMVWSPLWRAAILAVPSPAVDFV